MSIIFHIDVNSAFLSWSALALLEQGADTDIRTIPAIVGGDTEKRHGIVLAKSIPAKAYGISTAEPVVSALRKCPALGWDTGAPLGNPHLQAGGQYHSDAAKPF